jgi:HK97 family phage major capsid protein
MKYDVAGLRQARAGLQSQLDGFGPIDASTTTDQLDQMDAISAQINEMDRRIAAAENAQRLRAAGAVPQRPLDVQPGSDDSADDSRPAPQRPFAQARDANEPGLGMAQITRCLVLGKGNVVAAHQSAVRLWGERHPAAMELGAAMQTNEGASGGFLVPERYSAEIIDLLWPMTVVRRNVRAAGGEVPLVGGTDNFPTVESGTSAFYIGEGQDITSTEPQFGVLRMTEREIAALVPISNKLLRHASVAVDLMIRNMLVRSFAQTEDLAFLRGAGTGPSPKGIRYIVPSANVFSANATVNLTNIDADARKAELLIMEADIPLTNVGWVMAPRTFTYLRDLRNANGVLVYPSLSENVGPMGNGGGGVPVRPMWKGYPVEVTNNIPRNLGGSSDESELMLVAWDQCMIGDSYSIRIDASDTAAYVQSSTLVSAFSRNQTVIRAIAGHDFGMARSKGGVVVTGVKWF